MGRIIKIVLTVALCAVAVFYTARFVRGAINSGMNEYAGNINAKAEARKVGLFEDGTFCHGITVNNIPIGGMTYEEAKKALKPIEDGMVKDVGFTVRYGENNQLSFGKGYFRIEYNTDEILTEAISLAFEGEYEEIRQQLDELEENGREYTIECTVTPDVDSMSKLVIMAGESLEVEPINATCIPNPECVYTGGERFHYTDSQDGYRANIEDAVTELYNRAKAGDYGEIVMSGEVIEPEVKLSDLEGKIVQRSSFTSSYAHGQYSAPNRVFNIIKACGFVNGTVVHPKGVFSANDTIGPRYESLGWLPAPGFINGGANSVDSPGGGVCHVSSTLYNAVIRADLKIVHRQNHSSHVGYVPWGLDATIDTNRIDFKFSNNTKHDIYIFMWVNEKKKRVCCEIWGDPFPDSFDSIDFYAELVETIEAPSEPVYVHTSTLQEPYWYIGNRAKEGYKYQSYKQYYLKGKPVGDPVPVALSEYRMHPKRIYVWKGFDPAVDWLDPRYQTEAPTDET